MERGASGSVLPVFVLHFAFDIRRQFLSLLFHILAVRLRLQMSGSGQRLLGMFFSDGFGNAQLGDFRFATDLGVIEQWLHRLQGSGVGYFGQASKYQTALARLTRSVDQTLIHAQLLTGGLIALSQESYTTAQGQAAMSRVGTVAIDFSQHRGGDRVRPVGKGAYRRVAHRGFINVDVCLHGIERRLTADAAKNADQ